MKKQPVITAGRRKFLYDSAVVGAGAAIVVSSPVSALNLTENEQDEKKAAGYRMTEHSAAYYKTAAE